MVWIIRGIFAINQGRRFLPLTTMLNNVLEDPTLIIFSQQPYLLLPWGLLTHGHGAAMISGPPTSITNPRKCLHQMVSFFFFFFFFTFNWRTIALQCCVGFCHTTAWISHKISALSYICPLPLEPISQPQPHPTFLGCHKAPAWGPSH